MKKNQIQKFKIRIRIQNSKRLFNLEQTMSTHAKEPLSSQPAIETFTLKTTQLIHSGT